MNAFDKVIREVEDHQLDRSLTMVLRIATAIDDDDLTRWVKLELMGYLAENPVMQDDTVVPKYRTVPGHWYDDYGRLLVLEDLELAFINEYRLRQGVAELQGLATATGVLSARPREFSELIRRELDVEVSVLRFSAASVKQVLANIKLQLLDQLAKRKEKIASLPEVKKPAESEIIQLKPGIYGVSIDLKALWRRFKPKK